MLTESWGLLEVNFKYIEILMQVNLSCSDFYNMNVMLHRLCIYCVYQGFVFIDVPRRAGWCKPVVLVT